MTTKTNELAGLKIVEAFKTCKKGGREFDYFEQGYRAACTDFAQPAPVQEPVEQERESLRAAQSEAVMPLIGPLLDAWEGGSDFLNEYPELDKQLRHINRAMENAAPPAAQPAPVADTEIKDAYIASHGTDDGWLGIEGSYYISGYQSGRKANPPAAQPAHVQPVMVNMSPPATQRDRWMYEQGRLAERDPRTHADIAWGLAEKVRRDLDRQSCPGIYMNLAMESIVKHYTTPPAAQPAPVQQKPLFADIIAQHPGLAEELKAMDAAPVQEPCEYCKRGLKTMCLCNTPPAAQPAVPLTDEQIEACLHHVDEDGIGLFAFARAIEAAHGIKEKNA